MSRENGRGNMPASQIALACHLLAGVLFWYNPRLHLSPLWVLQFYLLLGTSAVLSIVLLLISNRMKRRGTLLGAQLLIMVIVSIPQGDYLGIEMTLAVGLLLQAARYIEHPYDKLCSALTILLAVFLHPTSLAWGSRLSSPPASERGLVGFSLVVVFTLGQLLRAWQKRHATQVQQITRLDEATQQLISANMGFQKYADSIEEKSAEEERKRITQEIHDTVAYTLVNIMMMLREASIICGKNRKLRKIHDQVLVEAQTGLNETRRALRILRASRQSRISAASEIHKLTTAFANATGVQVCVEYGNVQESLEAGLYTCVFHMIQEGMANALRHGRATKIDVHLWQTDSELLLYLRDNGAGCGAIEEGMGLSGMRERIQSLGGSFTAGNAHEGFQISARLPCGESSDG